MPTLIRLIVALLFIAGLGYAGLFALTLFVDPGQKDITVRIPARTFSDIQPLPPETPATTAPPSDSGQPPSLAVSGGNE